MSPRLGKRIFFAFFAFIAIVIFATVKFIESSYFAKIIQDRIAERIETELRISIKFGNLKVSAFPPGISINDPELVNIKPDNKIGLEKNTIFLAKRIGVSLRMFQLFSNELVVSRVFLEGAKIQHEVKGVAKSEGGPITRDALAFLFQPIRIKLQSGMNLNIKQIELRDSTVDLRLKAKNKTDVFFIEKIKFFVLSPEAEHYSSIADFHNVTIRKDNKVYDLELFKANFQVNAEEIHILSLDLKKGEAIVHAGGVLNGDIRFPKKMKSDVRVIARAKVGTIKEYFSEIDSMEGAISVELGVSGSVENYKINGRFEANEFEYNLWENFKISTNLELTKSSVKLDDLEISKNDGVINFKPLIIDLNIWGKEIFLQPNFTNVVFQEFCGDLKTSLSNLEAVVNGSLDITIKINEKEQKPLVAGLDFKSHLDLSIVTLTNQTWGKKRPRNEIFTIPQIKLYGHYRWVPFKFSVVDGHLNLTTGDLQLSGFVDNEYGWNLRGVSEEVDIGVEFGRISGVNIGGKGAFKAHVDGPPDNVFFHFDLEMDDAKYVNLNLGEIKGRVSVDDDKSLVNFEDLTGVKGEGSYVINGNVDISHEKKLNFDVKFIEAEIDGVLDLFRHQLREIDWVPFGIRGVMNGDFKVRGTHKEPEDTMDIRGRVKASKILYKGEVVSQLTGLVGLRRGKYFARDVNVEKHSSEIIGGVTYSRVEGIQYEFDWLRGSLRDIDFISSRGIPINAKLVASAWGKGQIENFVSRLELTIENGLAGTMPLPDVFVQLDSDESYWDSILMIGSSGNGLRVQRSRKANQESSMELNFESQNFGFLVCMINIEHCNSEQTKLIITGGMQASWIGSNWKKMNGEFYLSDAHLIARDFQIKSDSPVHSRIKEGVSKDVKVSLSGASTNILGSYGFNFEEPSLNYSFKGHTSLKGLKILTPLVSRSSGDALIDVWGSLRREHIDLRGSIRINNGNVVLSGLRPGLEGLEGKLSFLNDRLVVNRLKGTLGQGQASIDGYVLFRADDFPVLNLEVNFRENKVRFYPVSIAEVQKGRLTLIGDEPPYLFSGEVVLNGLLMKQNFDMKGRKSIKSAKYLPDQFFGKSILYSVRIDAKAFKGVVVRNDILDAEFSGSLRLLNNFAFPQIVGRAELIKGQLLFRNTSFDLDHTIVRATNPLDFEPWISIGGTTVLDNYRITIFASGSSSDPKINLGSSPPLPQENILSLLAFGYIDRPEGKINPDDLSAITYTEVGSILLDQLRLNKNLQSRGLKVRVAPEIIQNEANIVRPRAEVDTAVPKIIIQTQITEDVDVLLGTTVGSSKSEQFDLNVEYHLSDKVSVQSVYEQEPGTEAGETRTSFGADLKFKWGFK